MDQFHPGLGGGVVEHRTDGPALEFGVGVLGASELDPQRLERAEVVQAAAQLAATLVHHDADPAFGVFPVGIFVLMPVLVAVGFTSTVRVAGNAVAAVEQAVGAANESTVAHP